jgi:RimJ/RimL family protein N-acetyltransferase
VVLDRIDLYLETARLSIYLGDSSSRQCGVGFTAAYLALLEGFDRMNLHKIWLTVHGKNYPAINTYTRLGFKLEGILRDEFWLNNQRLHALCFGLLRREFYELNSPSDSVSSDRRSSEPQVSMPFTSR